MKVAYERAFTRENCRKSWDKIGVIPFTRRVYWELAAEERHRAELKAKSEKMGSAEVVEKLQEMDAKSIVAVGEAARAAVAAAAAHSDPGDDDGDNDDGNGSDGGGPVEKQLTSTLMWKKPANARANVRRMEKRARQLEAAANKRKRKEEEKEKAARKAKRQNTTEG